MAHLNTVDRKQRAYDVVDTSQAHGSWVEENYYNKRSLKGTLIGNWQEERALAETTKRDTKNNSIADTYNNVVSKSFINHEDAERTGSVFVARPRTKANVYKDHNGRFRALYLDSEAPSTTLDLTSRSVINGDLHPGGTEDPFKTLNQESYKPSAPISKEGARTKLTETMLLQKALQETRLLQREPTPAAPLMSETKASFSRFMPQESAIPPPKKNTVYTEPAISFYANHLHENQGSLGTAVYATKPTSKVTPFAKNASFSTPISEYNRDITKAV